MLKLNKVVLIRHAQSQWNLENRFTGWANPPLTIAGQREARKAAMLLHSQGLFFDVAFSSYLQRSSHTLEIILRNLQQESVKTHEDWRLNERHYGMLQGLDKSEAIKQYGEQQIHRWRRGYHDKPASMVNNKSHRQFDERYKFIPENLLPNVESLADTQIRVMQFWQERIIPLIDSKQQILISAHGNTLRALMMALSGMSIDEVENFEIPTATPIVYLFDQKANPIDWQYLKQTHRHTA